MENEVLVCLKCESTIKDGYDYCTNCGNVIVEDIKCHLHTNNDADGFCLACLKPFCTKCGLYVSDSFLCNDHCDYEVIEGMARVYGSSDHLELSYFKDVLEKEGIHPFLYSRKSSPISLGNVDYSLFRPSGEYDGHLINEIKLMVPLNEIIEAEKIIETLINNSQK